MREHHTIMCVTFDFHDLWWYKVGQNQKLSINYFKTMKENIIFYFQVILNIGVQSQGLAFD